MLDSLTDLANRRALARPVCEGQPARRTHGLAVRGPLHRLRPIQGRERHIRARSRRPGHRRGRAAAEASTRSGDRVIRYGGDEFVMLCNDMVTTPTVLRLAQRLIALVNEPIDVGGEWVTVSASVGASLVDGERNTMDQVLSSAESAVGPRQGARAPVSVSCSSRVTAAPTTASGCSTQLHRAYERGEFVLHYQPIVSMADKSMIGVEALLRWQHPERGLLLPGLFVEELEESGLILPVGEWVLERACRQTRTWTGCVPAPRIPGRGQPLGSPALGSELLGAGDPHAATHGRRAVAPVLRDHRERHHGRHRPRVGDVAGGEGARRRARRSTTSARGSRRSAIYDASRPIC